MNNLKKSHSQLPSNKKFGWFFATLLALLAAYFFWKNLNFIAIITMTFSLFFLTLVILAPRKLTLFNRIWHALGLLLGKISNPIILGLIFFVLITPIALITRLFGRDELKIKRSSVQSYWINRLPPGPNSDSFKNQY